MRFVDDNLTIGTEPLAIMNSNTNTPQETLNVRKEVALDHTALSAATVMHEGPSNKPMIAIELTANGRKAFAELTRQNIGKRLAIVVDGKLLTAPIIRSEIPGGSAMITGNFSDQEAKDLASKINNAIKR